MLSIDSKIKKYVTNGNFIAISITVSFGMASFDMSFFFSFINVVELISIIALFDLDVSNEMRELFVNLRVQKSVPNGLQRLVDAPKNYKIQSRFVEYGYDSSLFVVNSGNTFILLASILIAYIIQKLLFRNIYEKLTKLKPLHEYFHYNIFFKYWLQTSFELLLTSTYGFSLINKSQGFPVFDLFVSLLIFVSFN